MNARKDQCTDSHDRRDLAPGLFPVLQTFVALRFILPLLGAMAIGLALAFSNRIVPLPRVAALLTIGFFLIEALSLLIFVSWPAV